MRTFVSEHVRVMFKFIPYTYYYDFGSNTRTALKQLQNKSERTKGLSESSYSLYFRFHPICYLGNYLVQYNRHYLYVLRLPISRRTEDMWHVDMWMLFRLTICLVKSFCVNGIRCLRGYQHVSTRGISYPFDIRSST